MVVATDAEQTSARPFSQYVFKLISYGSQAPRDSHMKWRHNGFPLKTQSAGGCRRSSHQRGSKLSLPPSHTHCVLGVGDVMFRSAGCPYGAWATASLRTRFEPAPAHPAKPVLEEPPQPNICRRETVILLFADIL
jgi:hypothetical protein